MWDFLTLQSIQELPRSVVSMKVMNVEDGFAKNGVFGLTEYLFLIFTMQCFKWKLLTSITRKYILLATIP